MSVEQTPCWKITCPSGSKDSQSFYCRRIFIADLNRPQTVHILSQINLVHAQPFYVYQTVLQNNTDSHNLHVIGSLLDFITSTTLPLQRIIKLT
jgi:hypothetical protein